jgi:mannose-1-phosphate guanylyltransferase
VVGSRATVADGALVWGSVLLDECTVGEGAQVSDAILGRGAQVGAGSVVEGAVLADGVLVGPRNELRPGVRLFPGAVLGEATVRFSSDLG